MPRTLRVPAALTALALAGWMVNALLMPDLASPASFLALWTAMSAAMMLPALVPAATLAAALGRSGAVFVGGYLAVWIATGVLAFAATRVATVPLALALLVAAAYQLSPFKSACLRRCRSPLGSLLRRGVFAAGLEHGGFCLGCCWALMLAVLAVGAGSLLWMAALAVAIFVEKATFVGARARAPIALALIGAAVWIAL